MNDKVYNILKYVAMIVLPAIGTLYSALAGIWVCRMEIRLSVLSLQLIPSLVLCLASVQLRTTRRTVSLTTQRQNRKDW